MDLNALHPFPTLKTERLCLRRLRLSDDTAVFQFRSDPRVGRYLNRPLEENLDGCRDFIQNINEGIDNREWMYWGLALQDNDYVIGTVCLWNLSVAHSRAEVGFELHPDFQRQGFMHEAVTEVLAYSFNQIGVKNIEACFHPLNQGSRKLLERHGFQFARTLSGNEQLSRGKKEDLLIYCLAATEGITDHTFKE